MSTVAELLDKDSRIVSIRPSQTIAEAAKLLNEKQIGAVLVCDSGGALVGILSERDIVRSVAANGDSTLTLKVEDLMTREVRTCRIGDSVESLMEVMTTRRHRHMPVCDESGKPVAVVSIRDLVKSILDQQEHEMAKLRNLTLVKG